MGIGGWLYENSWAIIISLISLTGWLSVLNYKVISIPEKMENDRKELEEDMKNKVQTIQTKIDMKTDMLLFVRLEENIKGLVKSFDEFKCTMEKNIDEIKKKMK